MNPIRSLSFLLSLFISLNGFNQLNIETQLNLNTAEKLFQKAQFAEALTLFKKTSSTTEYATHLKQKIIANTGVGKCYLQMEMIPEAHAVLTDTYQNVLGEFPDTSVVLLSLKTYLSWSYAHLGDLNKELEMSYELIESYKACSGDMRLEIADTYNTIATNFSLRGDLQNELFYIKKAVELIDSVEATKELSLEEQFSKSNIYSSYSVASLATENFTIALHYANKTLTFYNEFLPHYRPIAIPYLIKSKYFSAYEKNLDSSLFYINKALAHLEADFGDGFPGIQSQVWLAYAATKARIFNTFGEYGQAHLVLDYICDNWQIEADKTLIYNPSLLIVYNELGKNNYLLGNIDLSVKWYKTGLNLINKNNLKDHKFKFKLLVGLRNSYAIQENWEKAIDCQKKALDLFGYDFSKDSFIKSNQIILNPAPIECGTQTALFLSDYSKELAHYFDCSEKEIMFRSLQYFKKSISMHLNKKLYLFEVGINEGYGNENINLYEGALALIVRLEKHYPEQNFSQEALWIIEMSKSNLLKKAVYSDNLYESVLSVEDQNERNLIRATIFEAKQNITADNDTTLGELRKAKQRYSQFNATMEKNYPSLKKQHNFSLMPIANMRAKIDNQEKNNQLTLNYFQGDKHLYYTSTINGKVRLFQKIIPLNFEAEITRVMDLFLIDNIINKITETDNIWFEKLCQDWYKLLIEDALIANPETNKITIVPHRNINYISADYLGYTAQNSFRYLIEDYPISYHYSQFVSPKNNTNSKKRITFGGFAASDCGILSKNPLDQELSHVNHGEIPSTRVEIEKIASLFKGDAYYRSTPEEFKSKSANYAILHLALHAITDNENPDQSRLFFCSNESNTPFYSLTASDLAVMNFNADMTVLSACNTGIGKLKEGEGVLSLMRVFLQTGSNSVISTLWEVSDEKTASIMIDFYKELNKNKSKSEALRQAKLNYLASHNGADRLPYFWSGLVIYGDDSPLNQAFFKEVPFYKRSKFYLSATLMILVISVLIFYRFKASKS
ncbi:MAG: CHAT domain-containing protein [Crocinitomix sp.]|nr:CHAT domain-containing protein [Crocinitomix sp.]